MKKIVLHSGFHPESPRTYQGEFIQHVVGVRKDLDSDVQDVFNFAPGDATFYKMANGGWIKDLGGEKYVTDWTAEERWSRVEEVELDDKGQVIASKNLGFILRRVDRSRGLL